MLTEQSLSVQLTKRGALLLLPAAGVDVGGGRDATWGAAKEEHCTPSLRVDLWKMEMRNLA